jgi:hypothetical protein
MSDAPPPLEKVVSKKIEDEEEEPPRLETPLESLVADLLEKMPVPTEEELEKVPLTEEEEKMAAEIADTSLFDLLNSSSPEKMFELVMDCVEKLPELKPKHAEDRRKLKKRLIKKKRKKNRFFFVYAIFVKFSLIKSNFLVLILKGGKKWGVDYRYQPLEASLPKIAGEATEPFGTTCCHGGEIL